MHSHPQIHSALQAAHASRQSETRYNMCDEDNYEAGPISHLPYGPTPLGI
jgi:hypothetical protein